DPLVGNPSYPLRRALGDARPPGLMLVREPDELGLERAHPQLALRARLVELAEANGHGTADDDRTPARLDDDHLQTARVARRRDEAEPGQQLELAVDRLVAHARRTNSGVIVGGGGTRPSCHRPRTAYPADCCALASFRNA